MDLNRKKTVDQEHENTLQKIWTIHIQLQKHQSKMPAF